MAKDTGKVLIHGKEYETVASRVSRFRSETSKLNTDDDKVQRYSIETKLIDRDENTVVMKATIRDLENDKVVSTGHAEERRTNSGMNATSALEVCETSAIGRALAAFGLAGTEFASADEVAQAISQQGAPTAPKSSYTNPQAPATDKQKQLIAKKLAEIGIPTDEMQGYLTEQFGVDKPKEMTLEQASFVLDELIGDKS